MAKLYVIQGRHGVPFKALNSLTEAEAWLNSQTPALRAQCGLEIVAHDYVSKEERLAAGPDISFYREEER